MSQPESLFASLLSPGGGYAQVAFGRRVDRVFTYSVPPDLAAILQPGMRVQAPFGRGNRPTAGFCVALAADSPNREVKSLTRVLDDVPLLSAPLLKLTRWMADYYLCGWGQVLEAVVPAGAKAKAGTRQVLVLEAVAEDRLPTPSPRLTPRQARAYSLLREAGTPLAPAELARRAECGIAVVLGLVKKGYARRRQERVENVPPPTLDAEHSQDLKLNPDQEQALTAVARALAASRFESFLLHGVTGSGKTEIYLRAIDQAVRQGQEALVLVPEISLTPQTIQRFQGRFPRVAVLHSHLSDAERGWHWRRIAAGQVQVVVGARSAVFAPTRRLGLIVVDEEHEGSFKQETTPRYHGRDVAVMRAKLEGIPIILGSATPSLESWYNVERKQYTLLSLPARVLDRPLPQVHLIDMRHEGHRPGRFRSLSSSLERGVKEALDRGGQVILLLNRRGFDTYLLCPACGHVVKCRFCEVALTHHRQKELAVCHYCGYEQAPPDRCPECGLSQVKYLGLGTEKLEAEVKQRFPGVAIERMDSDSMKRPGSHARVLNAFRRGEIRILLGTQMIAKGLDFPQVTLVGVVNADTALYMPDFRASERTFQLLAQVAGRAGRGPAGGRVLVQTYNPEHPCISLAAQHDFLKFAAWELGQRREHGYPPYQRMARVLLRGKNLDAVQALAEALYQAFRAGMDRLAERQNGGPSLRLLGPAEAPLSRLKGYHRWQFQLQANSSAALHELLRGVLAAHPPQAGVDIAVDVDPLNML